MVNSSHRQDAGKLMGQGDILVVGGGQFGQIAVQRLGKRVCAVVEPQPTDRLRGLNAPILQQDGVSALAQLLSQTHAFTWVVPALPLHLLADWLRLVLARLNPRPLPVPQDALPKLPQFLDGGLGRCYVSLADFQCPDDCPEPAGRCTVTGQPRGQPLYQRLSQIQAPGFNLAVLRSHQLAPGVGGVKVHELLQLQEKVARGGGRWLLATACLCHGVLDALEFDAPPEGQA